MKGKYVINTANASYYYEELMRYGVDITVAGYHIIGDNIIKNNKLVVKSKRAANLLREYRRDKEIKKIGYIQVKDEPVIVKNDEINDLFNRVEKKLNPKIDLSFNFGEYTIMDFYFLELMKYKVDITLNGYHIDGNKIIKNNEVIIEDEYVADLLRSYRSCTEIRDKIGFISVPDYNLSNKEEKKKDTYIISDKNNEKIIRSVYKNLLEKYKIDLSKYKYKIVGKDIICNNVVISSNSEVRSIISAYNKDERIRRKK